MKFIDLFAWLWWFHNALVQLWHECVFSSELSPQLRELYKKNYNTEIHWDIKFIDEKDIPKHDILCAWFPCQPFSHAWKQDWLMCDRNGNLFFEIIRILKYHKPNYFILENVANLKHHDKWKTWNIIKSELESLWYEVQWEILSPHNFGIPHHRQRIFIVWCLKWLQDFKWPEKEKKETSILSILDKKPKGSVKIWKRESEILEIWQEFLNNFPKKEKLPSFPIWAMEFWATYPYEETNPNILSKKELENYKWSFWKSLKLSSKEEQYKILPTYVQFSKHKDKFPDWKIRFIKYNREFYQKFKEYIDPIIQKLQNYPPSFQKFEWNCQWDKRDIYKHIIQFRASWIRIKKIDTSPSLISSTSSQIPIIWWEKRYMTKHEASKLQGMSNIEMLESTNTAFKALWNALNSDIVMKIAQNLIK